MLGAVPIFYLLTALSLFFIFSWPFFPPVWLPIGLFFLRIVLRSDCATHSTFLSGCARSRMYLLQPCLSPVHVSVISWRMFVFFCT